MARLKRTVLGIEIGWREIRIVEMRGGTPPQILRAGTIPLPVGAMDGDRIVQIDAVADIIRGLYTRLGCQARTAIVGMGIQSVVTRILAIPHVPDAELRTVLEGELAHYQILRSGTGAFDYYRMDSSSPNTPEALPSVLLMAVEDRIAQGYRLVIEKAGLQMLALEPISLSLFRAAYPLIENEPAALCLAITPQRSELSILDHSHIRLYRRLDMGSNDILRGRKNADILPGKPVPLGGDTGSLTSGSGRLTSDSGSLTSDSMRLSDTASFSTADLAERGNTLPIEDEIDTAELEPNAASRAGGTGELPQGQMGGSDAILPRAAASLANEVQRSLDYYRRESPDATAISRIILTTNDPDAEALSTWLAQALRMDVRVGEPPIDPGLPRTIASQLESPYGLRYLGAVGLAYQALTPEWNLVPRFNLSSATQSTALPAEKDKLTAIMVTAAIVLIGGLFGGNILSRNVDAETHNLQQMRQALGLKMQQNQTLAQQILDENTLNWITKSDNLPIPAITDLITQMPPGVGLISLDIQHDGRIAIEGNANDMSNFTLYYTSLLNCKHLVSPHYQSLTTDQTTHITKFRVETTLRGTQASLGQGTQ